MKLVEYLAKIVLGEEDISKVRIVKGREGDAIIRVPNRKTLVLKGFPYKIFIEIKDYNIEWIDFRISEKEKYILVWIDCELSGNNKTIKIINNKIMGTSFLQTIY